MTLRTPNRRTFLTTLGGALAGCGSLSAFDWQVVPYDTRDYVTAKDIASFYRFDRLTTENWQVWFRSKTLWMRLEIETPDMVINDCRFKLSHPVLKRDGQILISRADLCKLIDPVLRPNYQLMPDNGVIDTVVIDPGHGADDNGKQSVLGDEKFFVLDLAFRMREELKKVGLEAKLTREDDTNPKFITRSSIATETPRSLFISLHFNGDGSRRRDTSTNGIETYAFTPHYQRSTNDSRLFDEGKYEFPANGFDSISISLATAVHANLVRRTQAEDRGVRWARWGVLKNAPRPGILIEGGYLSNAYERQRIADPNYRLLLAQSITEGVLNFRRAAART